MKFKFLILVLLSLCVTLNAQIISENGIATDSATGLVWQDEPYTQVEKTAYDKNTNNGKVGNWEYSKEYCENLILGGYGDWRLPNIYELNTLLDNTKSSKPYVINGIKNIVSEVYWSSTTHASDSSSARNVVFNTGKDGNGAKTVSLYVRCVRAEQLNFDNLVILKNKGKVKISQENINEISPKKREKSGSPQSALLQSKSRATVTFFQEQDYKAPVGGTQFYSVGCSDGTGGVVSLTEVGKNYGSICGSNTQKGFNQCKPKNSWSLSLSAQTLCEN